MLNSVSKPSNQSWRRRILPTLLLGLCCAGLNWNANPANAQAIDLLNPGGDDYDTSGGNVVVPVTPVPPGDDTGWNATTDQVPGDHGVEGIGNNPNSAPNRLAFGSVGAGEVPPEDVMLFQVTDHTVAAGDEFIMSFVGRGFFEFNNATDDVVSFFGYHDGSAPVTIDEKPHPEVVGGSWTPVGHSFLVPGDSPLIGEDLAIGFYTQALDGGGFGSVDDITLMLGEGNPPGDADGDGDVDMDDVQLIADNFLDSVPVSSMGDLDDNGLVDFADFRVWKDATGFGGSLQEAFGGAVPEPGSAWLAILAIVSLAGTTRGEKSTV